MRELRGAYAGGAGCNESLSAGRCSECNFTTADLGGGSSEAAIEAKVPPGVLNWLGDSLFQSSLAAKPSPCFSILRARPEQISVCPSTIGVLMLYLPAVNGTCHRSLPSATPMPTRDLSVSVTSAFVPSTVMRTGEPYDGPSPVHFHFSSPLLRSYALIVPFPRPPRCAMHFPSTMIGEYEV